MAHNNRIRPPGGWTDFSVLLAAEMEAVDSYTYAALNADAGGTWAPSSIITIGGSGIHATGPLTADDLDGHITAGKTLTVDPDGQIDVGPGTSGHLCSITVGNYAFIGWQSGATAAWATGSTALWQSGSTFSIQEGCTATLERGASLMVLGTSGHQGSILFDNLAYAGFLSGSVASWESGSMALVKSGATLQVNSGATATNASVLGWQFTGTQPAKNVDPGADNIAIATNQAKAWGYLSSDGAGNVSCVDGMNVEIVALAGSSRGWSVTFARAMATSNFSVEATYRIQSGIHDAVTCWVPKAVISGTGGFDLLLQNSMDATYVDVSNEIVAVSFVVFGRQ